jgi:thioesterase III
METISSSNSCMSSTPEARSQITEIKVRGYHIDVFGHVNNARYLEFLEEGRWQWFEALTDVAGLLKKGIGFSIVNININYRKPAVLNDELIIETSLKGFKTRSGLLQQIVRRKGTETVIADASVAFVAISTETGRALPITEDIRQLFGE